MKPVVMISHFFPFPARAGAEIRASMILKTLAGITRVALISNNDGGGDIGEAGKYAEDVVSIPPLGSGRMKSVIRRLKEPFIDLPAAGSWLDIPAFSKALDTLGKEYADAVLWIEASWLLDAVKRDEARAIVLDQHNLDSEVLRIRALNAGFPLSELYRHDFRKQRAFEMKEIPRTSVALYPSQEEKELHEKLFGLSNAVVLPNLLDLDRYTYSAPAGNRRTIVMTGDFGYEPNREGAIYLVEKVLPSVREKMPDILLLFAGKGSRELPFHQTNIRLHGMFDRPGEVFAEASVAAVPIFTGGGSRYKILEALACGVPVVSTPQGAWGLELRDGDGILIREGERKFAGGLVSVLLDGDLSAELSELGRKKIEELYSVERGKGIVKKALEKAESLKR